MPNFPNAQFILNALNITNSTDRNHLNTFPPRNSKICLLSLDSSGHRIPNSHSSLSCIQPKSTEKRKEKCSSKNWELPNTEGRFRDGAPFQVCLRETATPSNHHHKVSLVPFFHVVHTAGVTRSIRTIRPAVSKSCHRGCSLHATISFTTPPVFPPYKVVDLPPSLFNPFFSIPITPSLPSFGVPHTSLNPQINPITTKPSRCLIKQTLVL